MKVILVLYARLELPQLWKSEFFFFKVNELSIEIKKLRNCLRGRKLEIWGKGGVFISPSGNLEIVLGTRTTDFKHPRRLRQIKHHLKINICAMAAILRLLFFARILRYC